MGARKRLAPILAKLEADAEARSNRADASAECAEWVERLSDELASAFATTVKDPSAQRAQRVAHGRVIVKHREAAAMLRGAATSLWGAANEIRAELAKHGTNKGMDRARHELLGKHGPAAITIAKRHHVAVDAMMCALKPLIAKLNGEELELDRAEEKAAAELFGDHPEVMDIAWPEPLSVDHAAAADDAAKAEEARVAKKLKAREEESARLAKARALALKHSV